LLLLLPYFGTGPVTRGQHGMRSLAMQALALAIQAVGLAMQAMAPAIRALALALAMQVWPGRCKACRR
jgi:hypothetical protein